MTVGERGNELPVMTPRPSPIFYLFICYLFSEMLQNSFGWVHDDTFQMFVDDSPVGINGDESKLSKSLSNNRNLFVAELFCESPQKRCLQPGIYDITIFTEVIAIAVLFVAIRTILVKMYRNSPQAFRKTSQSMAERCIPSEDEEPLTFGDHPRVLYAGVNAKKLIERRKASRQKADRSEYNPIFI